MSVEVISEHRRRAAHGKHVCCLCRRRIAAREEYLDQRLADNGTCWTSRAHLDCQSAYWSWDPDPEDVLDFHDLAEGHLPPCPWAWAKRLTEPCGCPPKEER